jgi:hypothetical protein
MKGTAIALVLLCAGCSDRSPTSPTEPSPWLGTWVGGLDNAVTGPGTLRLDIRSDAPLGSGRVLSGTWAASFRRDGFDDGGPLNGARGGQQLLLTLTSANPAPCPSPPGGAAVAPYALMIEGVPPTAAGTYVFTRCGDAGASGRLELRKQ